MNKKQWLTWEEEKPLYDALSKWIEDDKLVIEFISKIQKAIWDIIVWVVSCMDGRLSTIYGTIRIAGSWILLWDEIWEKALALIFKNLGVKKITTHNDCWAAGLYANWNKLEWNPDEITKNIITDFTKKYWLGHEYIWDIEEPHTERCIFVDTTARFNPIKVKWLTEWFVVTEKEFPINHVIDQINVSISIATWDHWYWEKINNQNPFFIFILGEEWKNQELDEKIKKIIEEKKWLVSLKYIDVK